MVLAAISFYLVAAHTPKSAPMWAAKVDLAPGQLVKIDDLEVRQVRLETHANSYLSAQSSINGMLVTRLVKSKELIPTLAITQDLKMLEKALVVLPVAREYVSSILQNGEIIDLYSVSKDVPSKAILIGKDLIVFAFNHKEVEFNNLINLTLIVPIELVEPLLSDTQEGNLRIVQHLSR